MCGISSVGNKLSGDCEYLWRKFFYYYIHLYLPQGLYRINNNNNNNNAIHDSNSIINNNKLLTDN